MIGMSGGVDSSVVALLLQQKGYTVTGLFMKNWEETDPNAACTALQDSRDAMEICDRIGIPFEAVNFANEYWEHVFRYFLDEYRSGRTPNPDVLCNKQIKFRAFLDYALEHGADAIATGHYARIEKKDDYCYLLKGKDPNKDQSYFLYALDQYQLSRAVFPLGELNKSRVRDIAQQAGFQNHAKKDSTGICFIGERRFTEFLNQYLPAHTGEIRTVDDEVIGTHNGLMFYTIGQRKGIGIGGCQDHDGAPWYVVDKRMADNVLVVAQGAHHPMLYSRSVTASNLNWITNIPAIPPFRCNAKTRYRQHDQPCTVTAVDNNSCRVIFDVPQRAMTPGQSIVFYHRLCW
jgi:tRNA-specific 2-thiouridylase